MKPFFFKVLTYPKSYPMKVMCCFISPAHAEQYARELLAGCGGMAGTWVKAYAQDPDDLWTFCPPSPILELSGQEAAHG